MTTQTDVLIIGAGPVGLFLANEVIRHGLTCVIIDKKSTLSTQSKALGIHVRTQEVFADCGFIDEIQAEGHLCSGLLFKHGEQTIAAIDFSHADSTFKHVIDLPQDQTEAILQRGLSAKNTDVIWQTELTQLTQDDQCVTATLSAIDGTLSTLKASYLVACDGAHSTVRHLLDLNFEGEAYPEHWWLADLTIDWALPNDKMIIYLSDTGPVACFPMQDQRYRLVMQAPVAGPTEPNFTDIQTLFAAICPEPAQLTKPRWISGFAISHRQIAEYRHGRIFLSGDAAHIHSPMGGQGMNTGIQDAYNLAWKLSLVQQGLAHDALLNSYHDERHLVGQQVLAETDRMTVAFTLKNPLAVHLRNHMMHILTSFHWVQDKLVNTLAELRIHYPTSTFIEQHGHFAIKAGTLAPSLILQDHTGQNKTLLAICQGTAHHLFIFQGVNEFLNVDVLNTLVERIRQQFSLPITVHLVGTNAKPSTWTGNFWQDRDQLAHQKMGATQTSVLLIRPDKYLGYLQTPLNESALITYLSSWCTAAC